MSLSWLAKTLAALKGIQKVVTDMQAGSEAGCE